MKSVNSTQIDFISKSSLLILITRSNLNNPINNKLLKYKYSSRNRNQSSNNKNDSNEVVIPLDYYKKQELL